MKETLDAKLASEKLSDAQLDLLGLEPGVSYVEVQAESEREPLPAPKKNRRPVRSQNRICSAERSYVTVSGGNVGSAEAKRVNGGRGFP